MHRFIFQKQGAYWEKGDDFIYDLYELLIWNVWIKLSKTKIRIFVLMLNQIVNR